MKNIRGYVIGAIVGAVLTISGQAFAGSISMIGKKITDENLVVVNGEELDVKAVNINGTTFTPNRALANELGLDIEFKNNTIYFSDKEDVPMDTAEVSTPIITPTELSDLDKQIDEIERRGTETDNKAIEILMKLYSIEEGPEKDELAAEYGRLQEEGKALRKQYDELVAKRSKLESQQ